MLPCGRACAGLPLFFLTEDCLELVALPALCAPVPFLSIMGGFAGGGRQRYAPDDGVLPGRPVDALKVHDRNRSSTIMYRRITVQITFFEFPLQPHPTVRGKVRGESGVLTATLRTSLRTPRNILLTRALCYVARRSDRNVRCEPLPLPAAAGTTRRLAHAQRDPLALLLLMYEATESAHDGERCAHRPWAIGELAANPKARRESCIGKLAGWGRDGGHPPLLRVPLGIPGMWC
eukprot:scaffold7382_cov406-Prasinococcus_capsulatus_cf.AAC.32